jgi:hypothetical protein
LQQVGGAVDEHVAEILVVVRLELNYLLSQCMRLLPHRFCLGVQLLCFIIERILEGLVVHSILKSEDLGAEVLHRSLKVIGSLLLSQRSL